MLGTPMREAGRPTERAGESNAGLAERVVVSLQVAEDSPRFAGHFPTEPLLPAVAQLADIVLPRVREHFGGGSLVELSRVKWLVPLRPGALIDLHLEAQALGSEGTKARFEIRVKVDGDENVACSGSLTLAPEPA